MATGHVGGHASGMRRHGRRKTKPRNDKKLGPGQRDKQRSLWSPQPCLISIGRDSEQSLSWMFHFVLFITRCVALLAAVYWLRYPTPFHRILESEAIGIPRALLLSKVWVYAYVVASVVIYGYAVYHHRRTSGLRSRPSVRTTRQLYKALAVLDMVASAYLTFITGGPTSPFSYILYLLMVILLLVLGPLWSMFAAATNLLCYVAGYFYYTAVGQKTLLDIVIAIVSIAMTYLLLLAFRRDRCR